MLVISPNPLPIESQNKVNKDDKIKIKDPLTSPKVSENFLPTIPSHISEASFSNRLTPRKKEANKDEELIKMLKKFQMSILFLNAVQ